MFFIEGVRNFVAAVDNAFPVHTVLYSDRLLTSGVARKLVRRLRRGGVPTVRVSPEAFRSISSAQHASGVGAILHRRIPPLEEVEPRSGTCWVVLSRVRSPGNFGCLMRTSAAVEGAGFILIGDELDPFDPHVVRGAMGAVFRQLFVRTTARRLSAWARANGLQVVGASPDGRVLYSELRYRAPPLILLGEERRGLSSAERSLCDDVVRIPMASGVDSLNLAVAGGLMMYQAWRVAGTSAR